MQSKIIYITSYKIKYHTFDACALLYSQVAFLASFKSCLVQNFYNDHQSFTLYQLLRIVFLPILDYRMKWFLIYSDHAEDSFLWVWNHHYTDLTTSCNFANFKFSWPNNCYSEDVMPQDIHSCAVHHLHLQLLRSKQ